LITKLECPERSRRADKILSTKSLKHSDFLVITWYNFNMDEQTSSQFIPPVETNNLVSLQEKPKKRLWLRIVLGIVVVAALLVGYGAVRYFIQERAIKKLEDSGSAEYKAYAKSIDEINNQWLTMENQMKISGSNQEDILLAKKDFINYIGTTILLKISMESSLTEIEKVAVTRKLLNLIGSDKELLASVKNKSCEYTEEDLILQDFFASSTLKFKKPMIYIEGGDTEKCSPKMSMAKYELWAKESWDSIIFDKSKIVEHSIATSTTFTVLGRIKVKRGGLFADETEHYVLRDSNGVVSVPSFSVFDSDFEGEIGESGSELYQGNKYIGHLVSDVTSGGIWIQGTEVPKEVVEANTPKIQTSFPSDDTTFLDSISKRSEFMKRIMFAIDEGKMISYTSKEVINNDIGKDLYTYKNGEVISDFGGKVSIKKNESNVSVIFENVPKGEDCYQFYYINDPDIYGFKISKIDGVIETYPETSSTAINNFKNKVCFSGKETSTIEFMGNISDIKKQAGFIRAMEKPRY